MVAGQSPWQAKLLLTVWTRADGLTQFYELPPETYGEATDVLWTLVAEDEEAESNA